MAGSSSFSSSTYHVLDEDVKIEILSRLSVKSLLRFKCVCKSWRALIKSPYFIKKHLGRNRETLKNGNNALLFITGREEEVDVTRAAKPSLTWMSSNNDDGATLVDQDMPSIDSNSLPFSDGNRIPQTILGPVNGIYCAIVNHGRRDNRLFLCNPSLREVKALPKFPRLIEAAIGRCTYGFGYDSNSNDFKVVAIAEPINYNSRSERAQLLVFVYKLSSSSRKSWKQIAYDINFSDLPLESSFFVCHGDGVVHWSALNHIYSFDLGKEVFRTFNLPKDANSPRRTGANRVGVLNDESIVFATFKYPVETMDERVRYKNVYENGLLWEVWVMKEYGVEESWTKLYENVRLPLSNRPLGVRMNNAEILFSTLVGKLVTYNSNTNQMKVLPIPARQACNYMESLVSINGDGG